MSDRKIAVIMFGVILSLITICSTVMAAVFHDAQYFTYGVSGVFTSMLLVGIFGFPID